MRCENEISEMVSLFAWRIGFDCSLSWRLPALLRFPVCTTARQQERIKEFHLTLALAAFRRVSSRNSWSTLSKLINVGELYTIFSPLRLARFASSTFGVAFQSSCNAQKNLVFTFKSHCNEMTDFSSFLSHPISLDIFTVVVFMQHDECSANFHPPTVRL